MTSDQGRETRRVVETLYRCGNSGDMAGALALVDDNVVLREPAFLPYGGTYKGIDGFIKAFSSVVDGYIDLPKLHVERLIVDGERAIGILRVPAFRGGEVTFAEEFLVRNGKIVEITLYFHELASVPCHNTDTPEAGSH
jgi:uncharacterized protein